MAPTIMAIGKSMGTYFSVDGKYEHCNLDLGTSLEKVSVDELLAWGCAHENAQAHLEKRFDRQALNAEIKKNNETLFNDDRDRILDRLFSIGALVEVDSQLLPSKEFLGSYSLVPVGRGFGNTEAAPERFGVGYGQVAEVFMGRHAYFLWGFGYQDGSIWAACEKVAAQNPKATALQLAADIADVVPALVAADCAVLERLP